MSELEWIAFIAGIAGVWLTIKENIYCWPTAMLSVIIYIFIFFKSKLYGDMALQLFYVAASIYGWFNWVKQKKNQKFYPGYLDNKTSIQFVVLTIIFFIPVYLILLRTDTDVPFIDAALTSFSLSNTWLMSKKKIENWLLWVAIDAVYVLLYIYKSLYLTSVLYAVFAGMALYGYYQWKTKAKLSV